MLSLSLSIVQDVIEKINNVPGENGAKVAKKMDNILQKNSGYKKLVKINEYHESNESVDGLDEYEPNELFSFRYAPITSCDVERSLFQRTRQFCQIKGQILQLKI